MAFWNNLNNAATSVMGPGERGGSFAGFLSKIAPALPIVGGIASNILAGINERKARLYNSPANQIARMREAGLPLAAGSNITAGGAVSTKVNDLGVGQINDNLGKSIIRDIDRKKLQIMQQELRAAKSAADLAEGNAKNQLNPTGTFEATNQGTGVAQTLAQQAEAVKGAEIINKWMPIEKAQNILKNNKEIEKITADTANSLTQNGILVSEGKIKNILAQWQPKMSKAEYDNLVARTTGINNSNAISSIQGEILRNTKMAQIQMAHNHAIMSGQNVASNYMGLILKNLETDSAKTYYQMKSSVDNAFKESLIQKSWLGKKAKDFGIISPTDLLYLQMFTPTQSSVNLPQMSNIFK